MRAVCPDSHLPSERRLIDNIGYWPSYMRLKFYTETPVNNTTVPKRDLNPFLLLTLLHNKGPQENL